MLASRMRISSNASAVFCWASADFCSAPTDCSASFWYCSVCLPAISVLATDMPCHSTTTKITVTATITSIVTSLLILPPEILHSSFFECQGLQHETYLFHV